MFISFSNGNGSAVENSLDSGRISFRKRPCEIYKDTAVGNVVAETGRDLVFPTTARLSDLSMPLTCEVRRSSANLYTVLICGESWIVLMAMLSPIVCDVQRQCCWKRGSGDGQRLSPYDYGTTERSFNAVERRGSTLTWTVCTAADSKERQICTPWRAYSRRELDCETSRQRSYAFSHRGAHFCLRGGWEKRGDLMWQSAVKHQRPAAKTTNINCCDRAADQVKQHVPEQLGWKNSKYWANIEKGIKLILKTIGNRKGYCAWSCSRWQTQPEKICKLQSTNHYNVRSEWHWFVHCDLQIFSGCVCHLEQLHAQSPFLFPIVFSINIYLSWLYFCRRVELISWTDQWM